MAQLIAPFDANQFDPTQGLSQLPIGKHPVSISASEIKTNSNGDGGFLELELKIVDGPLSGQSGAYRLNLYNKSEKAVEIAHKQMSALCHVTGVFMVTDSAQLHNIPFLIEVGFQKGQEPGSHPDAKGYTEVKRVFDINGNEPGKSKGAPAQQPQQQQAPQQMQQPAQQQAPASNPVGGFGSTAPAAQQQPAQQQQPVWGQQQNQQQPAQQQQPVWGQSGQQQPAAPWGNK